jgi:RNA 3'-terminal phosphate cyclase (ATP)
MKNFDLITIDGSAGEGGGQVLRSSLSLSLATGKPFRITRIRAGRRKPGLGRQHLTAVRAAATVCRAKVMGDEIGSTDLTFVPGEVKAGNYQFAVGTAGSATLVMQTVLPALLTADGPSRLELAGGTHNRNAPPYEFIEQAFLPVINRMGPKVTTELHLPGFEPAGGGKFTVKIVPSERLEPLELVDRGEIVEYEMRALVAHLDEKIGENEIKSARKRLLWSDAPGRVDRVDEAVCAGNIILLKAAFDNITEVTAGFGRFGVAARKVGDEAAREMKHFLSSDTAVGRRLADQIMLPLALAGGGRFTTQPLSGHAQTQIETIGHFLPVTVEVDEKDRHLHEVIIKTADVAAAEE